MSEIAAEVITAALKGAAILTVGSGKVTGDRIKLRPQMDDGDRGWTLYSIAYELDHPEFGRILAAYVDETAAGLAEAPQIRTILGRQLNAAIHADARANAEECRIIAEGDR